MITEKELRTKLMGLVRKPGKLKTNESMILPHDDRPLLQSEIFKTESSVHILELGSGWGEFAIQWLIKNPTHEVFAIESKKERIFHTLKEAERQKVNRLAMMQLNFNWFLEELLPEAAFDYIIVNFPDPWPKKRHWKHRLVQSGFAERMAPLLRPNGIIHLATDYGPYARKMLRVMRSAPQFEPVFAPVDYQRQRPGTFPPTKFEKSQIAQGYLPYFTQWRLR